MNDTIICKICGQPFKTYWALSKHISDKHNISKQEYYDKYFKNLVKDFVIYVVIQQNFQAKLIMDIINFVVKNVINFICQKQIVVKHINKK